MPAVRESLSQERHLIDRRRFLLTAAAAAASLGIYAGTHARHTLQVVPISIAIRNLPDAFVGFRFVQISDVHLEEFTEPWFLEHVVGTVNRLQPEFVVFTGDLVSRGPLSDPVAWKAAGVGAEILSTLRAPQRFAVLGNHDVAVDAGRVVAPLQAHGTPVLQDEFLAIERRGDRIWLAGSRDATYDHPRLERTLPPNVQEPVILLAHEPDFADYVTKHPLGSKVDLMLSGHSHGGQVRVPYIGPLVLPPLGRKYSMGHYRFGDLQLYTNRGIGTVGVPLRLNCPPEVTHFTLIRA